jgi:hypothetical protein
MSLLILLCLALIVLLFFTIEQFFNVLFRGQAPFISTNKKIIKKAVEKIQLNVGETVYELGCGRALFLKSLAKKFPAARYRGVEHSLLPYWLAKLQNAVAKSKIEIIKDNFFKINLSDANLIYCYLNPKMMEELSLKIKSECRPGTKIISYQFSLPGARLEKFIKDGSKRIYFYRV